jgi:hypothetical protein
VACCPDRDRPGAHRLAPHPHRHRHLCAPAGGRYPPAPHQPRRTSRYRPSHHTAIRARRHHHLPPTHPTPSTNHLPVCPQVARAQITSKTDLPRRRHLLTDTIGRLQPSALPQLTAIVHVSREYPPHDRPAPCPSAHRQKRMVPSQEATARPGAPSIVSSDSGSRCCRAPLCHTGGPDGANSGGGQGVWWTA